MHQNSADMFEHELLPEPQESGVGHLMSYEIYLRTEHPQPYVFEITNGDQKLLYFGAGHSYDPKDEQSTQITETWESFLKSTAGKNVVVFVEGGTKDAAESEEEAIKSGGEGGLISYLAGQVGIPVESPEPTQRDTIRELLKRFSREDVLYYDFARSVAQWHRTNKKIDAEAYVKHLISDWAKELGYEATDDLWKIVSETHEKLFGTKLDVNDTDHFDRAEDPTVITSMSSEVARATSILRDKHIVGEIEKQWKEGKSLFVMYGATHAVMQEPVLRGLLEKH